MAPREHIFNNTYLSGLAVRWKQLTADGRHAEAGPLLEEIVMGSKPMFERLAQYECYHYTVDLPILVSAAQEKIVRWLLAWDPKRGALFTWFGNCAKNAFRSEVSKVVTFRKRVHVIDIQEEKWLEHIFGTEDHAVDKHDAAAAFRQKINQLACRWGDKQSVNAIRYLVECIIDDSGHTRQAAVHGAAYAWGVSLELASFYYSWALCAIRLEMVEQCHVPMTDQDRFVHAYSHTLLPDLLNIVSWDQLMKIIAVFGGSRLKIPTVNNLAQLKRRHAIHREIDLSDKDPEAVKEIGRKHGTSEKTAQQVYEDMSQRLSRQLTGEHMVFDAEFNV